MKKRVLSGIQPTGETHLGNYLGAIQQWVASQAEYENIFCIVDLHAITVPQDPKALKQNTRQVAGLVLAAGIDPQQSTIFIQSQVSQHAELGWILNCLTPMGWLQRMTQFKEKSDEGKKQVSAGLFGYPVLMASDILLYDTDLVPVGEDQKQHVELTRDIAQHFNSTYGQTLKVPQPLIRPVGARIMGLDDPTKKMSKSETSSGHAIRLLDSPEEILAKFKRASTDSLREIRFDESRPGIYNLLVIYQLMSGLGRPEIEARFQGKGYSEFKGELAEAVIEKLRPIRARYLELTQDPRRLEAIIEEGASRARAIAKSTLARVMERVGLG